MLNADTEDSAISNESTGYILRDKNLYLTNMLEADTSSYYQNKKSSNRQNYSNKYDYSEEISSFNCDIPTELYSDVDGEQVFRVFDQIEHVKNNSFKKTDFTKKNTKFNNILKKDSELNNILNDKKQNQISLVKNKDLSKDYSKKSEGSFDIENNSNNIDFNNTKLKSILNDNYENQESASDTYMKEKLLFDIYLKEKSNFEEYLKKSNQESLLRNSLSSKNSSKSTLKSELPTMPENYFRKNNIEKYFSKSNSSKKSIGIDPSIDLFRNYTDDISKINETESFLRVNETVGSNNTFLNKEPELKNLAENISPIRPRSFKTNFIKTPFKNSVYDNEIISNDSQYSKPNEFAKPKKLQSTLIVNEKVDYEKIKNCLSKKTEESALSKVSKLSLSEELENAINLDLNNQKNKKLNSERPIKNSLLKNSKVSDLDLYNFEKNEKNLEYINSILKKSKEKNYLDTTDDEISSLKITKSLMNNDLDNEVSSFSSKKISFSENKLSLTKDKNDTITNKLDKYQKAELNSNKSFSTSYHNLQNKKSYLSFLTNQLNKVKDLENRSKIFKEKMKEKSLEKKNSSSYDTTSSSSLSSLKSLNSSSIDLTGQLNNLNITNKTNSSEESELSFHSFNNSKIELNDKSSKSFHCECCSRKKNGYQQNKNLNGSKLEKKLYSYNKKDDYLVESSKKDDFNVSLNEIFKKKCSKAFNNIQNRRDLIQQKIQQRKNNEHLKELENNLINKKKQNQVTKNLIKASQKLDLELSKRNLVGQSRLSKNMTMILMKK